MPASRIDRIAKAIAGRRNARGAAAQESTPTASTAYPDPELLFVQTFQAGAVVPKEGVEGRYTLALERGNGQTVYFSNRPDRIVGTNPTSEFLDGLGFPDDNPPNAALVVETAPGEIDIAVVELFSPVYDPMTEGVTYEIEVLKNWRAELEFGLSEAPIDVSSIEPSFGSAHLFIDGILDCPESEIRCFCQHGDGDRQYYDHGVLRTIGLCQAWTSPWGCWPCEPWEPENARHYWGRQCFYAIEEASHCEATGFCSGTGCPAFSLPG